MEPRTPSRKGKTVKRVRFSDPGPPIDRISNDLDDSNCSLSTGLTPAIKRTRIGAADADSSSSRDHEHQHAAKRARRRRSAPTFGSTDADGNDSKVKYEHPPLPSETQTFQFLSCSAILNPRARRRIARFGLSEEMNHITERKRVKEREEKVKEEELVKLREELSALRAVKAEAQAEDGNGSIRVPGTPERVRELERARARIGELEGLLRGFEEATPSASVSVGAVNDEDEDMIFVGDDITMDPDMITTSSSPIPSRVSSRQQLLTSDASTQIALQDEEQQAVNDSLNAQLENMKREKRALFKEWRSLLGPKEAPEHPISRSASPPPNLLPQIITTLRKAVTRESKATAALDTVSKDLSSHGFDGNNAAEVLASMSTRFRLARIELERAVPGETANGDLSNWKQIIDVLVARINGLVQDLASTQEQAAGSTDRETALRNQFNNTLHRLEQTSKKNKALEEASDSMAEDMLHLRMKMQKLEHEISAVETDKVRLNNAIERYRADLKILEDLNMKLEDDTIASTQKVAELQSANSTLRETNNQSSQKITELESSLLSRTDICNELQKLLDQRTASLSTLELQIEQLKAEHKQTITAQAQGHEKQLGAINVRLSLLSNALTEAQSEIQTLRVDKARLQSRLDSLQRLFSRETIHTARERASATVRELVEWEQGMSALYASGVGVGSPSSLGDSNNEDSNGDEHAARSGNSDGKGSAMNNRDGFAVIGSEPITPSCDRFVNVEVQRGKKRKRGGRRPDSGIEILVEEDEGEGDDMFEDSGFVGRS
ncbi:hypothetical protein FQN55_007665 [Onygenales sp. PD_40]|nr:hypothetical protein FQN55_007665 [Onygenales sp. PD_40]KAK2770337.1 hypothetical protein FQN53_005625 [Emmonsiellopsis sp. PD_33]KAK2778543.1 hypothetical protein FQN52_002721 [Onygenales sp. PD_12]